MVSQRYLFPPSATAHTAWGANRVQNSNGSKRVEWANQPVLFLHPYDFAQLGCALRLLSEVLSKKNQLAKLPTHPTANAGRPKRHISTLRFSAG